MKFVAITLLACIAAATSAPIQFSNNNVGDIITVDLDANAVLSSQIDQNILSVILGLFNQQAAIVAAGDAAGAPYDAQSEMPKIPEIPSISDIHITPELVEEVKALIQ